MNILVTGSNGQLGSEIKKLPGNISGANFFFTDIDTLDISNQLDLVSYCKKTNFQYIINCAAYTAVDKAETDIELATRINVSAVKNLAEAAKVNNSFLIHVSTDYVFSGHNYTPYKEEDEISPTSVYGKTKADGEKAALQYQNSIIIRTSWLYSSFGNNFVKTILRLAKERESLSIISDQVGTPTYAEDLAKTILDIIIYQGKNTPKPGIYHFSNEGVCSWYDFAKEIADISAIPIKVKPIETKDYPTPAQRPCYSVFNKSKIKTTFEIEIPYWKDSLKKCLKEINS